MLKHWIRDLHPWTMEVHEMVHRMNVRQPLLLRNVSRHVRHDCMASFWKNIHIWVVSKGRRMISDPLNLFVEL